MSRSVVLAGGSGFLGSVLRREFVRRGYEVIVLTRRPSGRADGVRELFWDGRRVGDWASALEGAAAVVNLAGRNVNTRYTAAAKAEIRDSRVDSVSALAAAVRRCRNPPPVWIQAASAAIYGNMGDAIIDENVAPAPHAGENSFSHEVCVAWENAVHAADVGPMRKIILRIGFVLAKGEGALGTLEKLARCYLGGKVASGGQWMSWIHHADFSNALAQIVREPAAFDGTYLTVSPNPARNADFMRALRRAVGRGWGLPAPAWLLPLGCWLMRTEPELALRSRRCVPRRLLGQGVAFAYPDLQEALRDILPSGKISAASPARR